MEGSRKILISMVLTSGFFKLDINWQNPTQHSPSAVKTVYLRPLTLDQTRRQHGICIHSKKTTTNFEDVQFSVVKRELQYGKQH